MTVTTIQDKNENSCILLVRILCLCWAPGIQIRVRHSLSLVIVVGSFFLQLSMENLLHALLLALGIQQETKQTYLLFWSLHSIRGRQANKFVKYIIV